MSSTILLCEPQCYGFEHAIFNAAFLYTVLLAYPEDKITFLAERTHLRWVQEALVQVSEDEKQRITWSEITIPPRHLKEWRRVPREKEWCRPLLQLAADCHARFLLFCSVTAPGLLVLKLLMTLNYNQVPVLTVLHGKLRTILEPQPRKPWRWLLSWRQVLRVPHYNTLHYLLLGHSIYRGLANVQPKVANNSSSLDMPYFWEQEKQAGFETPPSTVHFGYFGVSVKGFDAFYNLASAVHAAGTKAEFVMVGFMSGDDNSELYDQKIVDGLSDQPLTTAEYAIRATRVTYAMWTAKPANYRLTASSSFLDMLSYIKPGIYLRNAYIASQFEQLGDIGYLCDSYEEMQLLVQSLCRDFPLERYQQQCQNILQGRRRFEPKTLAPQLQNIISRVSQR